MLESDQIMALAFALEINRGSENLSVKELLEAPSKRSDVCFNGIFDFLVAVDPDEEK
jgi:hypothetical protein